VKDSTLDEYLVISRGKWDEDAAPQDVQRAIDQFYPWLEQNIAAGRMRMGSRLKAQGRRVSREGIVDGPFVETKEIIGGYWFILAHSLEEAAELAAQNPCMAYGLSYEIRPLDPQKAVAASLANETPDAWRHPVAAGHWLFSYGTLQQENVQLATFGRTLTGAPDSLVGFERTMYEIRDAEVVRTSGRTHHPMATYTGTAAHRIAGTVFEISDRELAQADRYEVPEYRRFRTRLLSGRVAWVYADARVIPPDQSL
jgi:hypothetical protein